jgi:hypothetical protein
MRTLRSIVVGHASGSASIVTVKLPERGSARSKFVRRLTAAITATQQMAVARYGYLLASNARIRIRTGVKGRAINVGDAARQQGDSSMNRHAVCATFVATVAATLTLVNTAAVAAKPAPQPPPSTPTSCIGVVGVGVFPTMVYLKTKYKTVKRGGGTTVYDGSDMYLADSNGKCRILILGSTYQVAFSYRQIGIEARVAFLEANSIRLLKFTVANGIVGSLPLSPAIVYTPSSIPGGVNDVELSADGQTIYFTEETKTIDGRWIDTLYSIRADCSSSCIPQSLYTFNEDNGVSGLSVNSTDDRIYMSIHDRVPDIRTISFLQKQDGVWSSLRHVVSDQDGGYESVSGFAATAIGRSNSTDLLAVVVESTSGVTTDIIDVTACAAAPSVPPASCLSSSQSSIVESGITGGGTSFTSTPSSLTYGTPSLLVVSGGLVIDVGLVDAGSGPSAPVTLLPGDWADSSD